MIIFLSCFICISKCVEVVSEDLVFVDQVNIECVEDMKVRFIDKLMLINIILKLARQNNVIDSKDALSYVEKIYFVKFGDAQEVNGASLISEEKWNDDYVDLHNFEKVHFIAVEAICMTYKNHLVNVFNHVEHKPL